MGMAKAVTVSIVLCVHVGMYGIYTNLRLTDIMLGAARHYWLTIAALYSHK